MASRVSEVFRSLGIEPVEVAYEVAAADVGGVGDLLARLGPVPRTRVEAADLGMDEIRAWLTALPVDAANEVITLWPSDRFAAKLRFGQFVAHLDDLWWPSRDDVIVVDQRGAMPKVLVIDHEERLTFGVLDDSWPR